MDGCLQICAARDAESNNCNRRMEVFLACKEMCESHINADGCHRALASTTSTAGMGITS